MTSPDWPAVHAEALDIFVRYLQIDSSNPPGAKSRPRASSAPSSSAKASPPSTSRPPPSARRSSPPPRQWCEAPPHALQPHRVVPVEAQYWEVPAFEGVIRDGRVYGRGAVDMKGCGVMQLLAFLLIHRQQLPLKRDLVFCAVPDEEAGSVLGMEWLCEHRPDVVDVEFELSEGGGGASSFGGKPAKLFSVATNEKDIAWQRLTAVGTPGHASRPHTDNSAVHLVRALTRLIDWDRGLTFTAETRAYLERLAEAGLMPAWPTGPRSTSGSTKSPELHAMFLNTLNLTMLDAGIKANVIPARSSARSTAGCCRGNQAAWADLVRERIADDRILVELVSPDQGEPAAIEWDTELFRTIQDVVKGAMEDAVVVPGMTIGGTDNRFLQCARPSPLYGFIPCLLSSEERRGFHGNNEFLTIDNLNMGCELMYEIVRRMVT